MKPRLLQLGLLLLALTGCQSIANPTATAHLRVIVASPNAATLDLYSGNLPLAYNLAFGNVTTYVPVTPGTTALSTNTAGTRQTLTAAPATLDPAAHYTLLLGDTAANLQQTVLRDRDTPAPPGQAALRILHQAPSAGPIDVYLVPPGTLPTTPWLAAQTFGANSGYLTIPAGSYRLLLVPAGAAPSIPLHAGPQVLYPSEAARTILLLNREQALQLITAPDFDPPS